MSMFKTGEEVIEDIQNVSKQMEEMRASRSNFFKVWFKPGETKTFRFYQKYPITYHQHAFDNGKLRFNCCDPAQPGKAHLSKCYFCREVADTPTQVGAIAVRHLDAEPYNGKDQSHLIKIWENFSHGVLLTFLDHIKKIEKRAKSKGQELSLMSYVWDITRVKDNSNSKTYNFFPEQDEYWDEIDDENMKNLPDWSKEILPPTEEEIWRFNNSRNDSSESKSNSKFDRRNFAESKAKAKVVEVEVEEEEQEDQEEKPVKSSKKSVTTSKPKEEKSKTKSSKISLEDEDEKDNSPPFDIDEDEDEDLRPSEDYV